MPAKKSSSKVAKKGLGKKKNTFMKWWVGLGVVALVAIVGIAIIRFSNASGPLVKLVSNNGQYLTIQYVGTGTYNQIYPVYGHLGVWNYGGVSPGAQACFVLEGYKGAVQVGQLVSLNQVPCP